MELQLTGELLANPFLTGVRAPDKVEIAKGVVDQGGELPAVSDLRDRLTEISGYIAKVNGLPELPPRTKPSTDDSKG